MGEQSERAKVDQPSGVQSLGLSYSTVSTNAISPPLSRFGHSAGSSPAAWNTLGCASEVKSYTLQRHGSRPLASRGGARSQSWHLQNAGTFRSGPAGCPYLHSIPSDPDEPSCPSPLILENNCLQKLLKQKLDGSRRFLSTQG
ncbi:hypothetical protein HJG60_007882 [Phyllostomus discolor]|uniref:Uncharacterized protein n=1 Tax=Phyllostomus discolor TaxID=89673 RepID=A0A834ERP5_9CHIR|nr:hypothetical protein HJG60_007882 [Phyllostomus discolor]